jgi:hypothetical protein
MRYQWQCGICYQTETTEASCPPANWFKTQVWGEGSMAGTMSKKVWLSDDVCWSCHCAMDDAWRAFVDGVRRPFAPPAPSSAATKEEP